MKTAADNVHWVGVCVCVERGGHKVFICRVARSWRLEVECLG